VPPTPAPPTPPPTPLPPVCEAKKKPSQRQCELCSERLEWDVRQGHATYDPARKLWWNDVPGRGRQYFNKDCHLVNAEGVVLRRDFWGIWPDGVICPECPEVPPPPTPTPTPPAPPTPTPPPLPPSDDKACELQPDGMYPLPPEGTCPACWRAQPDLISYWGISFRSKTQCGGPNCPYGIKINVDLTPHSPKRFLRHRLGQPDGGGSDTLFACQPCGDPSNPECRAAIPEIWVYPPGAEPGLCDPFSGSLYWCHHKPQAGQEGPTKFEVRAPPFRSVIVNVP
jgi:hypothetical protein